jgi:hypothetical protein
MSIPLTGPPGEMKKFSDELGLSQRQIDAQLRVQTCLSMQDNFCQD